jgi:uncharacterized small protein (TIGR04563 family)
MNAASEKDEQVTFWESAMLEDLTKQAQRLDRSLSWCAQRAWTIARAELSKPQVEGEHPLAQKILDTRYASNDESKPRKQTLFFPPAMLTEIKTAAKQQDRSISWLMQRAWCLAVSEIEKTPAS